MLIAREETFGPVAAVLPFDSKDEVIARANASEMGLAAYVYTNDLRRALRLSEQIEYGMVGIIRLLLPARPFRSAAGSNPDSVVRARGMGWRNTWS